MQLSHPDDKEDIKIKRFMGSQAILLSLMGVPAIYIHSLLGSRNYNEGVKESGIYRRINREKLLLENLEKELNDKNTLRNKIFNKYVELIKIRKEQKAFHPNAKQKVIFENKSVFSFIRASLDNEETIIVLNNVSNKEQKIKIDLKKYKFKKVNVLRDLISNENVNVVNGIIEITLNPYQFMWLKG
ncbi:Maltogenic Amylase, C-terminal domain [Caloranaerobacter azorensis DSM 13643]|uniref:Maltogenic Amylase, C-terminal domain n=1 Tax=Caloranaerobacter azorensis DSM 13643 TaxID=1121264 RepID=A0A1M5UXV0_9FIRM|nr:alpha-glucosidase C-terminal domain-containing protein [Caloranaerobacter azorensis]SHH67779.1 Maltogenic Amylase, C-terminal domain [Caloranaerobacter azorensis DSM 13643]